MKLQRVFVGIKASPTIIEACRILQLELRHLPVRFVSPDDLHLTLLPPWEITVQSETEAILQQVAMSFQCFDLQLRYLSLTPNLKPKLIWISCEASIELIRLSQTLLASFHQVESRTFLPHITLARIPKKEACLVRSFQIDRPINLSMSVNSIQLFTAHSKDYPGYRILASMPLNLSCNHVK